MYKLNDIIEELTNKKILEIEQNKIKLYFPFRNHADLLLFYGFADIIYEILKKDRQPRIQLPNMKIECDTTTGYIYFDNIKDILNKFKDNKSKNDGISIGFPYVIESNPNINKDDLNFIHENNINFIDYNVFESIMRSSTPNNIENDVINLKNMEIERIIYSKKRLQIIKTVKNLYENLLRDKKEYKCSILQAFYPPCVKGVYMSDNYALSKSSKQMKIDIGLSLIEYFLIVRGYFKFTILISSDQSSKSRSIEILMPALSKTSFRKYLVILNQINRFVLNSSTHINSIFNIIYILWYFNYNNLKLHIPYIYITKYINLGGNSFTYNGHAIKKLPNIFGPQKIDNNFIFEIQKMYNNCIENKYYYIIQLIERILSTWKSTDLTKFIISYNILAGKILANKEKKSNKQSNKNKKLIPLSTKFINYIFVLEGKMSSDLLQQEWFKEISNAIYNMTNGAIYKKQKNLKGGINPDYRLLSDLQQSQNLYEDIMMAIGKYNELMQRNNSSPLETSIVEEFMKFYDEYDGDENLMLKILVAHASCRRPKQNKTDNQKEE